MVFETVAEPLGSVTIDRSARGVDERNPPLGAVAKERFGSVHILDFENLGVRHGGARTGSVVNDCERRFAPGGDPLLDGTDDVESGTVVIVRKTLQAGMSRTPFTVGEVDPQDKVDPGSRGLGGRKEKFKSKVMPDKSVHTCQNQPRHGWPVLVCAIRPFVIAMLAIALVGCSQGKIRHSDGHREGPVVILGDSLAAGFEMPKGAGFVEVLSQRLGVEITNLGQSGATTSDSLPRVAQDVLPLKPALVIIELGGNDALRKIDPKTTRANLAQMISEVQAQGVPVMLLGVRGGLMSDGFAGMYEELATEYETAYVSDILEGLLTRPELKHDSIHPNAKGHQRLADKVEPELRRVLQTIGKVKNS